MSMDAYNITDWLARSCYTRGESLARTAFAQQDADAHFRALKEIAIAYEAIPEQDANASLRGFASGITNILAELRYTQPSAAPASLPKPGTQAGDALDALLKGPINRFEYKHGKQLAGHVQLLKTRGIGVQSNRTEHGYHIAVYEYTLDPQQTPAIAAALAIRQKGLV